MEETAEVEEEKEKMLIRETVNHDYRKLMRKHAFLSFPGCGGLKIVNVVYMVRDGQCADLFYSSVLLGYKEMPYWVRAMLSKDSIKASIKLFFKEKGKLLLRKWLWYLGMVSGYLGNQK